MSGWLQHVGLKREMASACVYGKWGEGFPLWWDFAVALVTVSRALVFPLGGPL